MNKKELAPIVLFIYNRPVHTRKTLQALSKNKLADESVLYVYSDGAKENAPDKELRNIEKTRKIVNEESDAFKKVNLVKRNRNYGLARNIVEGITEVIKKHKKVIVLEDDIVTSLHFLEFMNEALNKYRDEKKVMHISGFIFEHEGQENLPGTFFLKFMACWGWATWADRWQLFVDDPSYLLNKLDKNNKLREFNLDGVINFDKQLQDNIDGKIETWAIKWFTTIFLNDGLCLYPNKSLVRNIGLDGTGVHHRTKSDLKSHKYYVSKLNDNKVTLSDNSIEENVKARNYLKAYFKSEKKKKNTTSNYKSLFTRLLYKLNINIRLKD